MGFTHTTVYVYGEWWPVTWCTSTEQQCTRYITIISLDHNNHYGVHPYYMCMENGGKLHCVLLLNSNAQGA